MFAHLSDYIYRTNILRSEIAMSTSCAFKILTDVGKQASKQATYASSCFPGWWRSILSNKKSHSYLLCIKMTWHIFSKGKSYKSVYRKHSLCMTLNFLELHKECYHWVVKHFCILIFYIEVEKLVERFLSGRKATGFGGLRWVRVRLQRRWWLMKAHGHGLFTPHLPGRGSHEIYMENLLFVSTVLGGGSHDCTPVLSESPPQSEAVFQFTDKLIKAQRSQVVLPSPA